MSGTKEGDDGCTRSVLTEPPSETMESTIQTAGRRAGHIVRFGEKEVTMKSRKVSDEEEMRRFKKRVARILKDYEEKIQEARARYEKKARVGS